MERIEPLRDDYRAVFARFLLTSDDLVREAALGEASEIGKWALGDGPALDEMIELHQQVQEAVAQQWSAPDAGQAERTASTRLARGEATPLMFALLMPHELAQRAHHEQRWRREHETMTAMFEQTDDLIVVLDADGLIDDVNPAFCRATGWTRREAVAAGTPWPAPLVLHATNRYLLEQAARDGSAFLVEWSVSAVLGGRSEVMGHVCIGRDVTRARQIEANLRETDKLRAVATLAGGIAHDFNNLLGSILGLAELCALEAAAGSRQARNLGRIQQAGGKAAALVRQMLDFSRQTPASLERTTLELLLEDAEGLLRAALPKDVALEAQVIEDSPVEIDLVQIEQVLLNLTRNAAHAMRAQGGVVRIVADRGEPAALHGGAQALAAHARLRVIDHGEGMPPDLLQKIFEPFFTTKPVGEGTGLGLAAVHGIVSQHRGRIEVSSEPGHGTTFSVFLPIAQALAVPNTSDEPAQLPASAAEMEEVSAAGRTAV